MLVRADAGLRISLHVHHDAALPVALGVRRHLVACEKQTRGVFMRHKVTATDQQLLRVKSCLPDGAGVSCEASTGNPASPLPFLLPLELDGTVAKRPEDRQTQRDRQLTQGAVTSDTR